MFKHIIKVMLSENEIWLQSKNVKTWKRWYKDIICYVGVGMTFIYIQPEFPENENCVSKLLLKNVIISRLGKRKSKSLLL